MCYNTDMLYKEVLELISSAPYFTKQNLSLKIKGNLEYQLKKLLSEGLLIPIKKGTYISTYYLDTVVNNPLERERYFEYLANIIRKPSYVSLEYMLAKYGAIPESVFALTSVTTKGTYTYDLEFKPFIYKSISSDLFLGYKEETFKDKIVLVAKKSKALFDFLYFKDLPKDVSRFLKKGSRINWDVFNKKDLKEFDDYVEKTSYLKMSDISNLIKKEKLV